MQAKSKFNHEFELWHRLSRLEIRPLQFIVSAGVVVILVMAWVLTNPMFQLCDWLAGRGTGQGGKM